MSNENQIYLDNKNRISLIQFPVNTNLAESLLQQEINLNSSYPESIQLALLHCVANAYAQTVLNENTSISLFENTILFLSNLEQIQANEVKSKLAGQLKDMVIDEMVGSIASGLNSEFVFSDNWYNQSNDIQIKLAGVIAGRFCSLHNTHQEALTNIQSINHAEVRKIAEGEYVRSNSERSDEFYQFLLSDETAVQPGSELFMATIAGGINEEPERVSQVINNAANGIRRDCAIAAMLSIIVDYDSEGTLVWLNEISDSSIKDQIAGFLNI